MKQFVIFVDATAYLTVACRYPDNSAPAVEAAAVLDAMSTGATAMAGLVRSLDRGGMARFRDWKKAAFVFQSDEADPVELFVHDRNDAAEATTSAQSAPLSEVSGLAPPTITTKAGASTLEQVPAATGKQGTVDFDPGDGGPPIALSAVVRTGNTQPAQEPVQTDLFTAEDAAILSDDAVGKMSKADCITLYMKLFGETPSANATRNELRASIKGKLETMRAAE